MKKVVSELGYSLALLVLCAALGYIAGLALSALLSASIFSLPFWIRRIGPYLFPVYGVVIGLFLGGQELLASYVNARIFRQAAEHLGADKRLIRQEPADVAQGADQPALLFRSGDARRQIRITSTGSHAGSPQVVVHFEELQLPQRIYQEVDRRCLKLSEIERILQLERDYLRMEHKRFRSS